MPRFRCISISKIVIRVGLKERYNDKNIRALIGGLLILAITLIWRPAAIYSGRSFSSRSSDNLK